MHIGEKIEARAKELRMGPTELARRIRTSKQNVYGIYRRSSIDTELLQKLSKALDYDFFLHYTTSVPNVVSEPGAPYGKRKKGIAAPADDELSRLRREFADLREKYELLRELYETKTGKKVPGSQ
jgi:hypothetical protein